MYAALITADLVWVGLEHPKGEWIIHLGNWSRVVTALYFLCGSITAFHRSICGSKESDKYERIPLKRVRFFDDSNSCAILPGEKEDRAETQAETNHLSWHHEALWILHTLAADSSFVCTIAFFSLFFEEHFSFLGILDFPRHTLYHLLAIVDTLASYIPVRLIHVMYAYIFGAAYVVFIVVFILTEVKANLSFNPITYPSLGSGDKPPRYTAYLSIFLVVGFPVAQIFFFLIYKFRAKLTSN